MKTEKRIKNRHILVLGSGPSLKKYWVKIKKFIKEENVVTFGCNNIMNFLVPDFHFWGSRKRWEEFGHRIDNDSIIITSRHFLKKEIRAKWKGRYKVFNNVERRWKLGSDIVGSKLSKRCEVCYRKKKMFGCVRDISTWAIFYAYIKGASRISVVGNDGLTLYGKKNLTKGEESQHCYGTGHTDGFTYSYCRKKDWDKYKTLKLLYKYGEKKFGYGFEIITPTIYLEFYNSKILDIDYDTNCRGWKEPSKKEYYELYVGCLKKRKL